MEVLLQSRYRWASVRLIKWVPLNDLDTVVIEVLGKFNGEMSKMQLEQVLAISRDGLQDPFAVQLLAKILESTESAHLIRLNDDLVELTKYGADALESRKKPSFYLATIGVPLPLEFIGLAEEEIVADGLPVSIRFGQKQSVVFDEESDYEADRYSVLIRKSGFEDLDVVTVENSEVSFEPFQLLVHCSIVDNEIQFSLENGKRLPNLEACLKLQENTELALRLASDFEWWLYFENTEVISFAKAIKNNKSVNWRDLFEKKQIDWDDIDLQSFESRVSWTSDIWKDFSKVFPQALLQHLSSDALARIDWSIVSSIADVNFILDQINQFPWDWDVVVELHQDRSFLEPLLLMLKDPASLDFSILTPRMSLPFIESNFEKFPFDLHVLSERSEPEVFRLVGKHSGLNWNWAAIVTEWPFQLVIGLCRSKVLDHRAQALLVKRALKNRWEWEQVYDALLPVFQELNVLIDASTPIEYSPKSFRVWLEYDWVVWGPGGVEENPSISFTGEFIEEFGALVSSAHGRREMSNAVREIGLIRNGTFISWDWLALSSNASISWTGNDIARFRDVLHLNKLLDVLDSARFIELIDSLLANFHESADRSRVLSRLFQVCSVSQIGDVAIKHRELLGDEYWLLCLSKWSRGDIGDFYFHVKDSFSEIRAWEFKGVWDLFTRTIAIREIAENLAFPWSSFEFTRRIADKIESPNSIAHLPVKLLCPAEVAMKSVTNGQLEELEHIKGWIEFWSYFQGDGSHDALDIISVEISFERIDEILAESRLRLGSAHVPLIEKLNWSILCGRSDFPIHNLSAYSGFVDWSELQRNIVFKRSVAFNSNAFKGRKEWRDWLVVFLRDRPWDWSLISEEGAIVNDRWLLMRFSRQLDWSKVSQTTRAFFNYETIHKKDGRTLDKSYLKQIRHLVDWYGLTSRPNLAYDNNFFLEFANEKLNWQEISKARLINFNGDDFYRLRFSPWDYDLIKQNDSFTWDAKGIQALLEIGVGFAELSGVVLLSSEFIQSCDPLCWDFNLLLINKNLSLDLGLFRYIYENSQNCIEKLCERADALDSDLVIDVILGSGSITLEDKKALTKLLVERRKLESLSLSKLIGVIDFDVLLEYGEVFSSFIESLVDKYPAEVNWSKFSKQFGSFASVDFVQRHCEKWDWSVLTRRIHWDSRQLGLFHHALDWEKLSCNHLSWVIPEDIIKYSNKWSLVDMSTNVSLSAECRNLVKRLVRQRPLECVKLTLRKAKLGSQPLSTWSGRIYHFAHLHNVISILDSCVMLSRNRVRNFVDSAGSVVNRRQDAHNFVRFYFRPRTFTQFYNEQMGLDYSDKHFGTARSFNYPKMPIPVFISIDIEEILEKVESEILFYSNGNMQTNHARVFSVLDGFEHFNAEGAFLNSWEDRRATQQEFLIKGQLSLLGLDSLEILVRDFYDEENLLQSLEKPEQYEGRIISYDGEQGGPFNRINPNIQYANDSDSEFFNCTTDYEGDGYCSGEFRIFADATESLRGRVNGKAVKFRDGFVRAYPNVSVDYSDLDSLDVTFYDELTLREFPIFQFRR